MRLYKKVLSAFLIASGSGLVIGGCFLEATIGAAIIGVGGVVAASGLYIISSYVVADKTPSNSKEHSERVELKINIPSPDEKEAIDKKIREEVPPTPNGIIPQAHLNFSPPPMRRNSPSLIPPPAPNHKEEADNPNRARHF